MKIPTNWKTPALLLTLLAIAAYCFANDLAPLLVASWAVALTGWWHSERSGGRGLPRWSVLSMVLGVVLWTFFRANTQRIDVTIFGEFLTLVLLVKTWDRKGARDVGQLIAMSIFLIIGAILDNNSLVVGLIVLISMPLTAWAVMALQVGGGTESAESRGRSAMATARSAAGDEPTGEGQPRAMPRLTEAAARTLTPLAAAATIAAFFIALGVFLVMPRGLAASQWGSWARVTHQMQTGFTQDVELGRAGLLTESPRVVLEAAFSDESGASIGGEERVYYLRGAVLGSYQRGRWVASGPSGSVVKPLVDPSRDRVIIQDIDLRESHANKRTPLFAVWCNKVINAHNESIINTGPGQVWYREAGRGGSLRYRVTSVEPALSSAGVDRSQIASFPSEVVREYALGLVERGGFEPDPQRRPPADDASVARILTSHLRGNFEYTTMIASPDAGQDPIEWFLTVERRGHCEYFASALAAMCQAVGINARVVAGYIATEFDESRGVYTVRESNAHAWAEVEVARGIWITHDPTPPVALMNAHAARPSWRARISRYLDSLNDAWTNSVVMFDNQKQHRIFDAGSSRSSWIESLTRRAADDFRETRGRSIIKYVLAAAAILLAAAGLSVAAIRAAASLGVRLRRQRPAVGSDPEMLAMLRDAAFYDQALDVLAGAGLARPVGTPAIDHARSLATIDADLASTFERIATLYYRPRFGRRPLTPSETAEASALVVRLRGLVAGWPPTPARTRQ
ncbi:MAG: DUF3488 domain-containing protein [Phycisphaeraceae bacterium]|nr:DUF3488 domain-containing protein [Phycisphaerae bacterium]MBX3392705.1 DUF3488 domain-containing protein [Phycisphaeraceae bacterium]